MKIANRAATIAAALAVMISASGPLKAGSDILSEFVVDGDYEDVRFSLDDAIVSRGLKITDISHVSAMLQRTADVVPGSKQIYKMGQQFQFCSAVLSRNTMQADPANIAFCPYMIFMYERVDKPGKIHVGFRRLPEMGNEQSKKALAAINKLLTDIITEASEN